MGKFCNRCRVPNQSRSALFFVSDFDKLVSIFVDGCDKYDNNGRLENIKNRNGNKKGYLKNRRFFSLT